ncbi:hypothetical protein [Bacillus rhizoplanae]|uniref:hypothetical protein n=1 Tax=Bacillus rhizoplanae TaxID=2880966 RepID=UPI003D1A7C1A
MFGNLFTGELIRHMGRNYEAYANNTLGLGPWGIPNKYVSTGIGKIKIHEEKWKCSSVTGNIGESVVVPALAHCLGLTISGLPFQRIKAYKTKCPDFRVGINWVRFGPLFSLSPSSRVGLPTEVPLEVKTTLTKDNKGLYNIDALEQLHSYWKQCEENGYNSAVGYGIIACVDLDTKKNPGSYQHYIRYYLFFKNDRFSLKRLTYILKVLKDKKKKINKKSGKILKDYDKSTIQKWIGMQFL